jgi:hypothetical protein
MEGEGGSGANLAESGLGGRTARRKRPRSPRGRGSMAARRSVASFFGGAAPRGRP